MVSVSDSQQVEGRNGIRFQVDQSLRGIDVSSLDMVFLAGGPGVLLPVKNILIIDDCPALRPRIQIRCSDFQGSKIPGSSSYFRKSSHHH